MKRLLLFNYALVFALSVACVVTVVVPKAPKAPDPVVAPAPTPAPLPPLVVDPQPAPMPVPAPPVVQLPAPPPVVVSVSPDAVDFSTVSIVGPVDVHSWPVTTSLTGLDFAANGVRVEFTKRDGPNRWPDVVPPGWDGGIEYTLWMVCFINGRWYTSGGIEYWNGLDRNGGPPSQFAANWYYNAQMWAPLTSHQPAIGEQVLFFVTAGDQRAKDAHKLAERSNLVAVSFPSDAGAAYSFPSIVGVGR